LVPVVIADCGELKEEEKLNAGNADFLETYSKPWNNVIEGGED
jgi:hypothetical protein